MTDRISPALTPEEWADVLAVGACVALTHAKTRKAEAAILLYGQPFGFTRADVEFLGRLVRSFSGGRSAVQARDLAARIAALLPPETP